MRQPRNSSWGEDMRSKRQQILDAAYEVFSRKGYYCATVDEIIHLADTGKGTVYNYFTNKEQLFYTVAKERSEPYNRLMEQAAEGAGDPLAKIKQVILLQLQFLTQNADLWRVMLHEMRGLGCPNELDEQQRERQREKYHALVQTPIAVLQKVVQEGIDRTLLKDVDSQKLAYALYSIIVAIIFQKFIERDLEATAASITRLFLHGVAR